MRMRYLCTALAAFALVADVCVADGPAREARSENGQYVLRINPGQRDRTWPCEAMLRERTGSSPSKPVWKTTLVNDVAPMQAYVRNDGKIVVTLDEFQRGGARNAVVIYGARGELLRHFLITDLLNTADFKHVRTAPKQVNWLDGAKCGFSANGQEFVIRLNWGREVRIDLRTLQAVQGDGAGAEPAAVPPEVLAALLGDLGAEGEQVEAADTPGHEEAETATAADATETETEPAALETTGDEMEAPGPVANEPDSQEAAVREALTEAPRKLDSSTYEAEPGADSPDEGETEPAAPPAQVTAGIDVPLPDPANPVDYVGWLNSLGVVDGPDAEPVYAEAIDAFAPWQGEGDVLWEAARGDTAALASPELATWLTQNDGALEKFGEASRYPTKGWSYATSDGSMISVELPQLASLRGLARASVIAGREAAQAGDAYEAADRYLDTLAAGAHIGNGPTVIENLVGVAVQDVAADALLDLQADHPDINMEMLAEAAEAAYTPVRPAAQTVQFERAFFLDTVQRMWQADPVTGERKLDAGRALELLDMVGTGNGSPEPAAWIEQLRSVGFEQTVASGQSYYDGLTEAMQESYSRSSARLGELEASVEAADSNPLVRTLVPALGRYAFVSTRAETLRRGALLVTRLNAYSQENGSYPESLEAIGAAELEVDPFSAAPFVYRRTADGFELYSVGGNGTDDGGVHDAKGDTGDLRLWPRPAK